MEAIRIVHTADNHFGLSFRRSGYSEELRTLLIAERFEALQRVVHEANKRKAHFLVVAGDLFDHKNVAKRDVERVAGILNAFEGLHVVVLPGNHDYDERTNDPLWGTFMTAMKEHLLIFLREDVPVSVSVGERSVVFYPGPCRSKTSPSHAIGWVSAMQKNPAAVNIGIAHGCVSGISLDRDDRYFQMSELDLRSAGVDFWLLGHTHVRWPSNATEERPVFYFPSTHTPDGFDCKHEGYAWFLVVDENKKVNAESMRTGGLLFVEIAHTVRVAAEIADLRSRLASYDAARTLLQLKVSGRLSEGDRQILRDLLSDVQSRFLYVEYSDEEIGMSIDRAFIDAKFAAGSLPHRLLSALAEERDDGLSMQIAYDLIEEFRR